MHAVLNGGSAGMRRILRERYRKWIICASYETIGMALEL